MVPFCRSASTLKVTVPGAMPSLLHFVPSGRFTFESPDVSEGRWASALQPLLSAMWAQSGPHPVTTQVERKPGPFGMKVPLKSSAAPAGSAKPTAAPAKMTAAAMPAVVVHAASRFAGGVEPLFASKTDQSAPNWTSVSDRSGRTGLPERTKWGLPTRSPASASLR